MRPPQVFAYLNGSAALGGDSGMTGEIISSGRFFHPDQRFLFEPLDTPNRLRHNISKRGGSTEREPSPVRR
jgi:hypothetical protein